MEVTVTQNAIFVDGKPNLHMTDQSPPWVQDAFKIGYLGVVRLNNNQAVLAVKTKKGIEVAEGGDRIANDLMSGLVVTKKPTNTLTWDAVEEMMKARENGT